MNRYSYDSTYEYLTSVETDDEKLMYAYNSDGTLRSVERLDGSLIEFKYNELGFVAGSSWTDEDGDLNADVSIENDGTGKVVSYAQPSNVTTIYIYDENANVGYLKELGQLSYRFFRNHQTVSKVTYIGDQVSWMYNLGRVIPPWYNLGRVHI